jgi:hypothetical protein
MVQQVMPARSAAPDPLGTTLGLAVFALGVALLVAVFVLAYRDLLLAGEVTTWPQMLALPAILAFKGALLFIMAVVGSAVASKGIALYQAARRPQEARLRIAD